MVDFSNREELEAWLRTQPREVAVTLAARAAGRALPAVSSLPRSDGRRFAVLTLAVLRATKLAYSTAIHWNRNTSLAPATIAAAAYIADAVSIQADATRVAVFNAAREARAADVTAAAARAARASARGIDASVRAAADAADAAAAFAAAAAYVAAEALPARATAARAAAIAAAASYAAFAVEVGQTHGLISEKLWRDDPATRAIIPRVGKSVPDLFADLWRDLKTWLLVREGENWSVWTDWYDAWLDGRDQFPQLSAKAREDLDIAICLIPDADWQEGPAHVNAIIRKMIDEALPKVELEVPDQVPPQEPAALLPVWSNGQLTNDDRPVVEGRPAVLLDAALVALREAMRKLADDFDKWVAQCVSKGRDPQVDRKPVEFLRDIITMIPNETPPLAIAFEIFHAGDSLAAMVSSVGQEWPDALAARFVALPKMFDGAAKLSEDWKAFTATESRPLQDDILAVPAAAETIIAVMEGEDAREIFAPSLVERLKRLVAPLARAVEAERVDPLGPDKELLAVDVVNSIGNIVKRLAEAGVAVGKLGDKAGKEMWTGFRVNLPKQTKKLGVALAKVAVWAPVLGGGGWLASQFEWFAPIWQLIKPWLK